MSDARTRRMRRDEIGESFEREVFAVQRNQHAVGGDERVEREQAERGRRVDDDEIELDRAAAREDASSGARDRGIADQLDLGAGEIARRGNRATEPIDRRRTG